MQVLSIIIALSSSLLGVQEEKLPLVKKIKSVEKIGEHGFNAVYMAELKDGSKIFASKSWAAGEVKIVCTKSCYKSQIKILERLNEEYYETEPLDDAYFEYLSSIIGDTQLAKIPAHSETELKEYEPISCPLGAFIRPLGSIEEMTTILHSSK